MFGKTAKKAKLLNDYVKIAQKNYRPNLCKKVATNLTAQNCFKSRQRFCEQFFRKILLFEFSKVIAKKTKLLKLLRKMFPKKLCVTKFC